MVDALREAHRVLMPAGVLVDVRPVTAPLRLELLVATRAVWAETVHSYSVPEDLAAADDAMWLAVSRGWLLFDTCVPFEFEIYCDSAGDLRVYVEDRKLRGAELPYHELDQRQRELAAAGHASRLRCRRPWMLSTYRKP